MVARTKLLFEDNFESPTYPGNYYGVADTTGNLNNSKGTSGTSILAAGPTLVGVRLGDRSLQSGELPDLRVAAGSAQSIQLDSSTPSTQNHMASRPFLLMPGYYKVEYLYVPDVYFSGHEQRLLRVDADRGETSRRCPARRAAL